MDRRMRSPFGERRGILPVVRRLGARRRALTWRHPGARPAPASEIQVSIANIKALQPDAAATPAVTRPAGAAADFAAVVRNVSAVDTTVQRPATAATTPTAAASDGIGALAGMLAQGNLDAARIALAQLGV